MRECSRCPHQSALLAGEKPWTELPCAHCTSAYARQLRSHHQKPQVISPAKISATAPDDLLRQRTVLAWTHISRTYPAASAYILAKIAEPALSYAAIARRYQVSKSTVQYQIGLAIMAEPDLAGLLQVDRTRTKRKAKKR